jgi:hypothetical protein
LREAAGMADAIITTGGVSVGEADFVREILARLGEIHFWKLKIKPGRPMAFGKIGNAWLFGLPGNPVAVMVNYAQFALDALLRLSGVDPLPARPLLSVEAANAIKKQPGRREYLRGAVTMADGRWQVKPCRIRDRASCVRCRRPIAWSCCRSPVPVSSRATACRCNCSMGSTETGNVVRLIGHGSNHALSFRTDGDAENYRGRARAGWRPENRQCQTRQGD